VQFLRSISELTGGKFLPEEEDIFADYGENSSIAIPLWNRILLVALILFLIDISIRRLPWIWTYFTLREVQD